MFGLPLSAETTRVGLLVASAVVLCVSLLVARFLVAVGGRGTLVGAVLVNAGKTYFTGALPELWLFALGLLSRAQKAPKVAVVREPAE